MKNFFTFPAICRKQFCIFLVTLSFCLSANLVYSQLKIVSSGNVGIDTSNPLSRFSIGDASVANSKVYILGSGTSDQKGLEVNQGLVSVLKRENLLPLEKNVWDKEIGERLEKERKEDLESQTVHLVKIGKVLDISYIKKQKMS
jgi:hypothetical protein